MDVAFDISGFQFQSIGQNLILQTNWNLFNQIQAYNSNVSTLRKSNYYQFQSYAEKTQYTQGQFLHQQRYPNSNWNSIGPY